MTRAVTLLIALLLLTSAAAPQKKNKSVSQVRQKTFEKVWKIVNEEFYDPNFGGVDWNKVRERYAPQAAAVKTDAELYDLLNKMLGELKVSHMVVLTPDELQRLGGVPVSTGLGLREIDKQIVVTRVLENSSAAKAGINPGYVVVKIDGEAVKNIEEASKKLKGAPNTTLQLLFLDAKDQLKEITLERAVLSGAEKGRLGAGLNISALFEAKRLENNIGYIRFSNFVKVLDEEIEAAIESMKDARGIIVDLRGNSGGDDSVALKMANLFFEKETLLMVTKTRDGEELDYKAKPEKNPFLGKLVILVDEFSGSASEQFSAGMQESQRAFIIGKTTKGEDLEADIAELPTGAIFIYARGKPRTPKGVVIEGRGVIPNREVNLSRKELLAGRDAQLQAALDYIINQ
jgi:carboxyl-terminal processing protease